MANENTLPARKEKTKGERELYSKEFRKWGGCYTRSSRTAMPEDRWYDLTNLQPIGDANVHTVPANGTAIYNFGTDTIYWSQYANLNGVDYLYSFGASGRVYQTALGTSTTTIINSGTLLSGAGSQLDQWLNLAIVFIDSTGLYAWNGTSFTKITVTGAPSGGQAICVYQNRVWVAQGRILYYSVPAFTNAANTGYGNNSNDWSSTYGAGFAVLTDPQIRSSIVRLVAANGYMYAVARSSINVIADVYVPTSSTGSPVSPPTPVFTNLNIQAIIGTDQPAAIFALDRALILANRYGVYALNGTTAQKISDDIDGTWQYLSFAQPLSGGQVIVNNILTAAILITRQNDPVLGSGNYLAMWWAGKWWFASLGALAFVVPAFNGNGNNLLYGYINNTLYQLFASNSSSPMATFKGPLWNMGDSIRSKEVIRIGVELEISVITGTVTLNVDSSVGSTQIAATGVLNGYAVWINNSDQVCTWGNSSGQTVQWFNTLSSLYWAGAPGVFEKYVGISGSFTNAGLQLSALLMDYEFTTRWS